MIDLPAGIAFGMAMSNSSTGGDIPDAVMAYYLIGAVLVFTISFAVFYGGIQLNKFTFDWDDAMFFSFIIALTWFISVPVLAITGAVKWSIDRYLEKIDRYIEQNEKNNSD